MSALHAVLRGSGGVGVCCNAVLTRLMINRHRNPRCFGRGGQQVGASVLHGPGQCVVRRERVQDVAH